MTPTAVRYVRKISKSMRRCFSSWIGSLGVSLWTNIDGHRRESGKGWEGGSAFLSLVNQVNAPLGGRSEELNGLIREEQEEEHDGKELWWRGKEDPYPWPRRPALRQACVRSRTPKLSQESSWKHMHFKTLMLIYPSLTENKITTMKQKWLTNVLQQKYQCVSVWRKVWMERVDAHTHTPTHSDANTEKWRKLVPYLFPTVISTPPQRHAGKAN